MIPRIAVFLLRNDQLDAVWRESEIALDFARKSKYRDVADIIHSQQRFIATMQGRTETFSTFNDAQFDEATFEAQMTGERMSLLIFWYWTLKLKARFLAGDYAEALGAADQAKLQLSSSSALIQVLDYVYYSALTLAACYNNVSTDQQQAWRGLLTGHLERLREWADNYPPTFADKHLLVLAEVSRIEGRDADAMRLYERAIHSARENNFIQTEGLSHELAAGFFYSRGYETGSRAHLEAARGCYARWGAHGKVHQLERLHPFLRGKAFPASSTATFGALPEQLDVGIVVKASQALSGEIELGSLVETLMRIAVEHAGAERGLLILFPNDAPRIEAEATTTHGSIEVVLRQAAVTPVDLPESVLHYTTRTRESVILDDAATWTLFSADPYVQQMRPRSVLCLPLLKQSKLVGALYLENKLTPRAFTSDRISVLELLASQAAISLENARLYSDLRRSEAYLAEAQRLSQTGSFGWDVSSGEFLWSEETSRIFQFDATAKPTVWVGRQRVHPEDLALINRTIERAARDGREIDFEHRLVMPDGTVKHVRIVAHSLRDELGRLKYIGAIMDVTQRTRAAQALRVSEHLARGQLDALAAAVTALSAESKPEKFLEHVLRMVCEQLGAHSIRVAERNDATGAAEIVASYKEGRLQLPTPEQVTTANPPGGEESLDSASWTEFIAGGTDNNGAATLDPEASCIGVPRGLPGTWYDQAGRLATGPIVSILLGDCSTTEIVAAVCISIPVADQANLFFGIRFEEKRLFRPEDILLTQAMAHQATLAIRLMRLYQQSREAAVVAERNRMARDIHDTLAQGLTGVIVQMEVAKSALARHDLLDAANRVERAKELARSNLREARRSMFALRPRSLQGRTLEGALKVLLEKMTDGAPLLATCEIAGNERAIPAEWEEEFLRIAQEALTNVLKHAHAQLFKAILSYGVDEVQLQLIDDGRGFDLDREYNGFGLIGMKERVDRIRGRLMIHSTPGAGSEIRIVVRNPPIH